MLKLGGQGSIFGHRRPAIVLHAYVPFTQVDHGLHGEEHALGQGIPSPGLAVMQNVRGIVEHLANPVAAKVPHHGIAFGFSERLDRVADVAGGGAGADLGDSPHHRLIGYIAQPFCLTIGRARCVHAAAVPVPAVHRRRHVYVQHVPVFQDFVTGDAMANDMVDRGADRTRIAAIIQWGQKPAVIQHEFSADHIQVPGGDAGLHELGDMVQGFGR